MSKPKGLFISDKELSIYSKEDISYLINKGYLNKSGTGYKRMLVIPLDLKY